MFIAIVGTRFSGKSSLEEYLISVKGFTSVRIDSEAGSQAEVSSSTSPSLVEEGTPILGSSDNDIVGDMSNLQLSSSKSGTNDARTEATLHFPSAQKLLQYVTKNWQHDFVTLDLQSRRLVEIFVRRPFFLLLSIDAPLYERFLRSKSASLEDFVRENDRVVFGAEPLTGSTSLQEFRDLINVQVYNSFRGIRNLYDHLEDLNLLDPEILRPGWDAYFMTLASLASQRANCMKRRVGAVLVRENRVVSTGYNGTARGLRNCNEGGCPRCNATIFSDNVAFECVCLHAEENALLEAGRDRVGTNAVLYCNTCPCLRCTVKIIQTGVKTVVYNLSYKVDDTSALLFREAGVQLRRYNPNKHPHLPGSYISA